MPVEIREINISMTLLQDEGPDAAAHDLSSGGEGSVAVPGGASRSASLSAAERRELIDAAVRAVMQILRDKREA